MARLALLACVACGVLAPGCVNHQHSAASTTPEKARGTVSDLRATIRVISDSPNSTLGRNYAAALRWAGVQVVNSVKDADVVTELRQTTSKGAAETHTEVVLVVRGGTEQLTTARVSYPATQPLSKEDLGTLTSALTQSALVRSYADRVALERAHAAKAADTSAWQNSNADQCASSSRFSDCVEVVRYLNGFPRGEHRAEAEAALRQAEGVRLRASRDAAIARVKAELETWNGANSSACQVPSSPTACDGVSAYLNSYPSGRFSAEARHLLAASGPALDALREQAKLQGDVSRQRVRVTTARR